jgi:hypothetical protein
VEITYGRFNYFPYESSWAVFVKAAALNLVSPSRLIASLSRVPVARYWMSDDLHIKNMADALGLPQAAVDRCFIDSLTACPPQNSHVYIRHCRRCIAAGYHSVYFLLHMLQRCPWHDEPLIACACCSRACLTASSLRIQPLEVGFTVHMRCGHFSFCSLGAVRMNEITDDQWQAYEHLGLQLQEWFQAVRAINSPIVDYASALYDPSWVGGSVPSKCEQLINCGLHQALAGVGPFPVPEAITVQPLPPQHVRITPYRAGEAEYKFGEEDLFALYRCVRRYLYKRYIKRHGECYRYLARLTTQGLHALDCQAACTVSAAYLAWRLALRYEFGGETLLNLAAPSRDILPTTARQIMELWIALFYTIWAGIERTNASRSVDRDRYSVALSCNAAPLTLSSEAVSIIGYTGSNLLHLICIHAAPEWLVRQAEERCLKRHRIAELSNSRAWESVQFWAYRPNPRTFLRFWYGQHGKGGGRISPVVAAG